MTRQHNTKETKEMLIKSGINCIIEKGYAHTTLEDICRGAGLTRGAFYWNFNSKADILAEIVHRYENFYKEIYSDYEVKESAYDTLRGILVSNLNKKKIINPYYQIIRYKVEADTEIPDLQNRQSKLDEEIVNTLEKEISRGIEKGEFDKKIDAHKTAIMLFTYLLGVDDYHAVHQNPDKDNVLLEENIEETVENLMRLLKA